MTKVPELFHQLPIYLTSINPETNREATFLYWNKDDAGGTIPPHPPRNGIKVPSMPRFTTDGNPKEWVKGQSWWRASGWVGFTSEPQPDWKELKHVAYGDPKSDWSAGKWKETEVHPGWAHYPKKRYNYVTNVHEWQWSPFEDYKESPVSYREAMIDHGGFARYWFDKRFNSIAALAKHLRWTRDKVQARRVIVNSWLARIDGHELVLPRKALFSETEEELFLEQQAAIPPSPKQLDRLLDLFGIQTPAK